MTSSGQVIPPAEVDRLFQPFQRLGPRPARREGHGHGLGLSIVRAIATAHAATITAQPRPGGGLAIDVTFPRQPRASPFGTVGVMTDRAAQYPRGAAVTLAELREDPHPALARLREAEPVSWVPVLNGWLVTRWDLAAAVMRDSAAFTVDDPRFSTARIVGSEHAVAGRRGARPAPAPVRRAVQPVRRARPAGRVRDRGSGPAGQR